MSRSTTIRRILVPAFPAHGVGIAELAPEEALHLTSVLRLSDGDEVEALDGAGSWAPGILRVSKKRSGVEIDASRVQFAKSEPRSPITLEAALLKGDAMDWLIEKSVELGVTEFQPVLTEHSVVRIKGERGPEEFQARWQRIADQALKQCGRRFRMKVLLPRALDEHIALTPTDTTRIWLDESTKDEGPLLTEWLKKQNAVTPLKILLGPEGGFSYAERELLSRTPGLVSVSLGPYMLRAETAGLSATALIMGEFLWKNSTSSR